MDRVRRPDWSKKLRPLYLGAEPIDFQMKRRLGVVVVASVLFSGLALFFGAIFAGFGRWEIGLALAALIAPIVGWIWWDYLRLRRAVATYRQELLGDPTSNETPG